MIRHAGEVWLALFAFFILGSLIGWLIYRRIDRSDYAYDQRELAASVGRRFGWLAPARAARMVVARRELQEAGLTPIPRRSMVVPAVRSVEATELRDRLTGGRGSLFSRKAKQKPFTDNLPASSPTVFSAKAFAPPEPATATPAARSQPWTGFSAAMAEGVQRAAPAGDQVEAVVAAPSDALPAWEDETAEAFAILAEEESVGPAPAAAVAVADWESEAVQAAEDEVISAADDAAVMAESRPAGAITSVAVADEPEELLATAAAAGWDEVEVWVSPTASAAASPAAVMDQPEPLLATAEEAGWDEVRALPPAPAEAPARSQVSASALALAAGAATAAAAPVTGPAPETAATVRAALPDGADTADAAEWDEASAPPPFAAPAVPVGIAALLPPPSPPGASAAFAEAEATAGDEDVPFVPNLPALLPYGRALLPPVDDFWAESDEAEEVYPAEPLLLPPSIILLDAPRVSATTHAAAARADAVATDNGARRPPALDPAVTETDNLKRIKGIGPGFERRLNQLGIRRFDQIAAWSAAEQVWVDEFLGFPHRVERDGWVAQAAALAARDRHGGLPALPPPAPAAGGDQPRVMSSISSSAGLPSSAR